MKSLILAAAATLSFWAFGPGPVEAGQVFAPPKGCTGILTVQMHGCLVSNHYTCKADPAGNKWRVDLDQDGPFFASRTNDETEWLETFDLSAGKHSVLVHPSKKAASFSTLLKTGYDSYDFETKADDGSVEHVTGFDKLTGTTRKVSGIELEQTEFETSAKDADGKLLWKSTGHEYISRRFRIFLAGSGIWQDKNGQTPYDNSPAALILPGQPGFLNAEPEYDCNTVMSDLTMPPAASKVALE
ncbi:hypothetical protein FGG78_31345 [Thioclava sp. BHET1]|nr:hypothetical protein FGG78_31345 [Thioclava sp. BHET1]